MSISRLPSTLSRTITPYHNTRTIKHVPQRSYHNTRTTTDQTLELFRDERQKKMLTRILGCV
eukprot:1386380-Amorphochlora_amoeboformis.AAC.1